MERGTDEWLAEIERWYLSPRALPDVFICDLILEVKELKARLEAVKNLQRYSVGDGTYTTDNPDGEWMRSEEVLAALGGDDEQI